MTITELHSEVARLNAEIQATQSTLASASPADRLAHAEQELDKVLRLGGDAEAIAAAASKLTAVRAGTDESGTVRAIAESQLHGLMAALNAAQGKLREAELAQLKARVARIEAAAAKAYREYAGLVDVVTEKYLRLATLVQLYHTLEAQSRGAAQVNYFVPAECVEITAPAGYVPGLSDADKKKKFGREVSMGQPPAVFGVGARPWHAKELVLKARAEAETL